MLGWNSIGSYAERNERKNGNSRKGGKRIKILSEKKILTAFLTFAQYRLLKKLKSKQKCNVWEIKLSFKKRWTNKRIWKKNWEPRYCIIMCVLQCTDKLIFYKKPETIGDQELFSKLQLLKDIEEKQKTEITR